MFVRYAITITTTGEAKRVVNVSTKVGYLLFWAKETNLQNMFHGPSTVLNNGSDTNPINPGGYAPDGGYRSNINSIDVADFWVNGTAGDVMFVDSLTYE